MIYNRIDISARVDRGQEAIYRRVGLSFYMIDRNGKLTHSPSMFGLNFSVKVLIPLSKWTTPLKLSLTNLRRLFSYLKSTGKVKHLDFDFNGYGVLVENRGGGLLVNGSTMTRTTRHLSALCFSNKRRQHKKRSP